MSKAKVVFSDGSKVMAHNLDDQYERWQLRRLEIERQQHREVVADEAIDLFVPDLPIFTNVDEARKYRNELAEKQAFLQSRLAELNLKRTTHYYPDKDFWHDRAPLALAISRLNLQMHQCAISAKGIPERIRALKTKEQDGSLSADERIEIETLRASEVNKSIDGMLMKSRNKDDNERLSALENVVADLRKNLVNTQAKLISAYERIIELEG